MADSVAINILRQVRAIRGCSIRELAQVLPDSYRYTDYPPEHFLGEPLQRLVQWGLIQAFEGQRLLDPDELQPADFRLWSRDLTYFISPLAVAMEESLGFSFTGGSQAIFGDPIKSRSWPQLFMLMPFAADLKPVFDDHVKKVAGRLGLSVGRADDFFSTDSIVKEIWSAIYHAVIVVADCTGRNPNVFYEIGIAHTLGKDTILISQSLDDVPFDLRHLRVIVYEFTPRGMADFEERLRATLGGVAKPVKESAKRRRTGAE
ncbi:MAG: hypothetical protein AAB654_25045 [Acidobacteriota bacterium]